MVSGMTDIVTEMQDLRYLIWTRTRRSSGTAGSFLKSYDDSGRIKKYYKLSDYDPVKGIVGHECVNEVIVQRLMSKLGIEHLAYKLIHALIRIDDRDCETWLCESEDYKRNGESKIALEDYYLMNREEGESPLGLCIRMGWAENIYGMLVIDHLILNRDRHGANIEVLRSVKDKTIRLAPLFDHGLSLLCRCHDASELADYDVTAERPVQAFIGSGNTRDNIRLVPAGYLKALPILKEKDSAHIMEGVADILGESYADRIWDMIWERWCRLGDL